MSSSHTVIVCALETPVFYCTLDLIIIGSDNSVYVYFIVFVCTAPFIRLVDKMCYYYTVIVDCFLQ